MKTIWENNIFDLEIKLYEVGIVNQARVSNLIVYFFKNLYCIGNQFDINIKRK